jgi:hypothetical protein
LADPDATCPLRRARQVLRKEKEALAKKQRLVEQGLAAINADMAEFQKEKQGRLNQIEVVVALRMHQVGRQKGGAWDLVWAIMVIWSPSGQRSVRTIMR